MGFLLNSKATIKMSVFTLVRCKEGQWKVKSVTELLQPLKWEVQAAKYRKVIPFHNQFFADLFNYRVNSLVSIMFRKKYITRLNINLSIKGTIAGQNQLLCKLHTFISVWQWWDVHHGVLFLPATFSVFFNDSFWRQFSSLQKMYNVYYLVLWGFQVALYT